MSVVLEHAVALGSAASHRRAREAAGPAGDFRAAAVPGLPIGFPYLVDTKTEQIIQPVLRFLHETYVRGTPGSWVFNTVEAAANDLKDWWQYLDYARKSWSAIGREDIEHYRDAMLCTISPRTGNAYADATIRRRLTNVISFYSWGRRRAGLELDLDLGDIARSRTASPASAVSALPRVSRLLPPVRSSPDETVRPLTIEEYRQVAAGLGPLPSERADCGRSSRDRIACELALQTGMRLMEVTGLTVWQVLDLERRLSGFERNSGHKLALLLSTTKGSRPRKVLLPAYLLFELLAYIEGERCQVLASLPDHRDPRSLLVNSFGSGFRLGRATGRRTVQDGFVRAVEAAGLVTVQRKIRPETGEEYMASVPEHSFHDLRHTFAVQTYHSLKRQGVAEPWKQIQALLGHRHLSTTLNTYLRIVDLEEAAVSDGLLAYYRDTARG